MDQKSQQDELTVLKSIYDENILEIEQAEEPKGRIFIHPILPDNFYVKYQVKANEKLKTEYVEFPVKYLPPITLYFVLPKTYPSLLNPAFLLSCHWLTKDQLSSLCKNLDKLWNEGEKEVILYKWIQFLKEEALSFLGMSEFLDISDISDISDFQKFHQNRIKRTFVPSKITQNRNNKSYSDYNIQHQDFQNPKHDKNIHRNKYSNYKYKNKDNTIQEINSQYKNEANCNKYKVKNLYKSNYDINNSNRSGDRINHISENQKLEERKCEIYVKHKDYQQDFHNRSYKNNDHDYTVSEKSKKNFTTRKPTCFQDQNFRCLKENYPIKDNYNKNQNLERKRFNENEKICSQKHITEKDICETNSFNNENVKNLNRKKNQSQFTEFCKNRQTELSCIEYKNRKQTKHIRNKWDIKLNNEIVTPRISGGKFNVDLRAVSEIENKSTLITYLTKYTKEKEEEVYSNEWFTCGVCLEEKQGFAFMNFYGCNHKYCKLCMKSYFEIQIQEGNVKSLSCPKENCLSQATQYQINELVNPELQARYEKLLLNSILESMSDVMYCPRVFCQTPVILEPDKSMGICSSCEFVFCTYCKMVYHGVASCTFNSEKRKKIREEYLAADKETKYKMECRFGKRTLQMLVEDALSEEWVESNSKKCPTCRFAIEKIDGCNKMICWKCRTNFCWLCMMELKTTNPYEHFNNPNIPCFNQLFQGVDEYDDDDDDWEIGAFLI